MSKENSYCAAIVMMLSSFSLLAQQAFNIPDPSSIGTTANGWIGVYTTTPKAVFDIAGNISNGTLGAVFGRMSEGNNSGDGTFLGVRGFNTQQNLYGGKGFAIQHGFYGTLNSSINFYRGLGASDGFLTFSTMNDTERLRIASDGKIGIGTTTPAAMLDIQSNVDRKGIRLQGGEPYGTYYLDLSSFGNSSIGVGYSWALKTAGGSWPDLMSFYKGAVGIGTTFPSAKLDVAGGVKISDPTGGGFNLIVNNGFGGYFNSGQEYAYIAKFQGNTVNASYDAMVITGGLDGGKVGIGLSNPDEKLTVKGNIHANEVRVDMLAPIAPDYVFEEDYYLMSLSEVQAYINVNKHLPEVPSAKEFEENGMNLKEMNLTLLKKVEELTLHLIQLSERMEKLEIENQSLKQQNK